MMETAQSLSRHATEIRKKLLAMHFRAGSGHIGSGLSAVDILTYLYRARLAPPDAFILSKGHAASSLYATLHHQGIFTDEQIATYYQDGTVFPAHPAAGAHEAIVAATGSLGHGLSIACGMAFASRWIEPGPRRVVCLVSDGECNEGSVWEAAMFAAHHRLNNLTVVVDANGLQGFGRTEEVMGLEPLVGKWQAFGFAAGEVDGNDFAQLHAAFEGADAERPRCIVARTVKGKGIRFMEDKLEWHYLPMNEAQYRAAMAELEGRA